MAIRTVVTRGYGNGTFNGTIALVVLRGYIAGPAAIIGKVLTLTAETLTRAVFTTEALSRSTLDSETFDS